MGGSCSNYQIIEAETGSDFVDIEQENGSDEVIQTFGILGLMRIQ